MVAVANSSTTNGSTSVTVVAGEQASGLANIIGQYLDQLLVEFPEKRQAAAALRGRLGLHAREGDVAVTLVFRHDGIAIEEGLQEPDALMSGEVELLMHVLSGKANPAFELVGRRLAMRPGIRQPLFAYRAYSLMRLPGVHLWSGVPRPPLGMVAGGVAALGVLLALWCVRRQAAGGDDA